MTKTMAQTQRYQWNIINVLCVKCAIKGIQIQNERTSFASLHFTSQSLIGGWLTKMVSFVLIQTYVYAYARFKPHIPDSSSILFFSISYVPMRCVCQCQKKKKKMFSTKNWLHSSLFMLLISGYDWIFHFMIRLDTLQILNSKTINFSIYNARWMCPFEKKTLYILNVLTIPIYWTFPILVGCPSIFKFDVNGGGDWNQWTSMKYWNICIDMPNNGSASAMVNVVDGDGVVLLIVLAKHRLAYSLDHNW